MNKLFILLLLLFLVILVISFCKIDKFIIDNNINIIQTWKNHDLPKNYIKYINKIKNLKNINYIFFTDKDIDIFIKNNFNQYYNHFNSFKYKIQQIDFFRYLVIYFFGGIYLDLDFDIKESFDDLNFSKCIFPIEFEMSSDSLLHKQNFYNLIGNYAFYSPAKHPFLKLLIENIINNRINLNNFNKDKYVYYSTGPVMVTQTYIDFKNKDTIELIKPTPFKNNHFGKYGQHLNMGSWKK